MRNEKYVMIDRDLLLKLVNKKGEAAFGASINRSKAWVRQRINDGFMDSHMVDSVRLTYGIDITRQPISAETIEKAVKPLQTVEPALPKQIDYRNELSEIINRVDKMERNINSIDVSLRMILDMAEKLEKRSRNKPYAKT